MVKPSATSDFIHVQNQFAAHLRNPNESPPEGIEDRRLQIYRDLIYKNVEGFISGAFPVLRSLYADEHWHAMVRDFLVSYRCQTPYFLEISQEFLHYLNEKRAANEGDPPFLLELAHYEWAELALDVAEDESPVELSQTPDWLDDHIVLNPHLFCLSYRFPVHLIRPDFQPQNTPESVTCLLVYRDAEMRVKFSETNPLTLTLLSSLQERPEQSGREGLSALATSVKAPDTVSFVENGVGLLKQLSELGIILGTVKSL